MLKDKLILHVTHESHQRYTNTGTISTPHNIIIRKLNTKEINDVIKENTPESIEVLEEIGLLPNSSKSMVDKTDHQIYYLDYYVIPRRYRRVVMPNGEKFKFIREGVMTEINKYMREYNLTELLR
jgi:hypothetical protein